MKLSHAFPALSGLLLTSLVATAQATTLNFENAAPAGDYGNATTYSESGFTLTATTALIVSSTAVGANGYAPPRGSDFYSFCACGSTGSFSLFRVDGQLFSLQGFDAVGYGSLNFHVVGVKADNSQVVHDYSVADGKWGTTSILPNLGFSDLKSVTFYASGSSFTASLDDIVVSSVPVPAAAWLFGSALVGLGASGARRNARHA